MAPRFFRVSRLRDDAASAPSHCWHHPDQETATSSYTTYKNLTSFLTTDIIWQSQFYCLFIFKMCVKLVQHFFPLSHVFLSLCCFILSALWMSYSSHQSRVRDVPITAMAICHSLSLKFIGIGRAGEESHWHPSDTSAEEETCSGERSFKVHETQRLWEWRKGQITVSNWEVNFSLWWHKRVRANSLSKDTHRTRASSETHGGHKHICKSIGL